MIPHTPHPMTPHHLPTIKQKLPSNLHQIPPFENIPLPNPLFVFQFPAHLLKLSNLPFRKLDILHIFWSLAAEIKSGVHPHFLEERSGRVGVDVKRTIGEAFIMGNHIRFSTTDDNNGCRRWDGKVFTGRDTSGQGLEICLAGSAEEMADEDDELALVGCCCGGVEGAEGGGVAEGVVDGDVLHCGEGGAVGAEVCFFVGGVEVGVGVEAGGPVVGGHDLDVFFFGFGVVFGGAGGGEGHAGGCCFDRVCVGEDGVGLVVFGLLVEMAVVVHALRGCRCCLHCVGVGECRAGVVVSGLSGAAEVCTVEGGCRGGRIASAWSGGRGVGSLKARGSDGADVSRGSIGGRHVGLVMKAMLAK